VLAFVLLAFVVWHRRAGSIVMLVHVGLIGLALVMLAFITFIIVVIIIHCGGAMVVVHRGVVMLASLSTSSSGMLWPITISTTVKL
jgi:hypothetical protein